MVFGYFYKIVCVGTLTLHSKKPLDPHILMIITGRCIYPKRYDKMAGNILTRFPAYFIFYGATCI